jgi:copper chaperone
MTDTLVYNVPGISCEHCKRAIETELADAGLEASVDVDAKTVTVSGDADAEAVTAGIERAGYEIA